MVKWPFNRNRSEDYIEQTQSELPVEQQPASNLPEEVQEYYESGKRERVGIAWLLGLATLCVTLILAMGLFFGGRWVYRKIVGNNDKPTTTSQIGQDNKSKSDQSQNKQNSGSTSSSDSQNKQSSSSSAPSTPAPAPAPQPTPTPAPAAPAPTPAPTPVATPNTGPGEVVAIAIATAVVSSLGFYALQLRRLS